MSSINRIRQLLDEFEGTPESRGYDLRLSLADLVLERLSELGWTQRRLAEEAGMRESFVSRVIHADSNWTCDVAGRILFALEVRAELKEGVAGEIATGIEPSEWQEVATTLSKLHLSIANTTDIFSEILYDQEEDNPRTFDFETSAARTPDPQCQRFAAAR